MSLDCITEVSCQTQDLPPINSKFNDSKGFSSFSYLPDDEDNLSIGNVHIRTLTFSSHNGGKIEGN